MSPPTKSTILTDSQITYAARVATITSQENGNRDAALILTCFTSGLTITEIARLKVSDFLDSNGNILEETILREEISYNCRSRPLFWMSPKTNTAINAHLAERYIRKHGTTSNVTFRGLAHDSPLFVSGRTSEGLKISSQVRDGKTYYSANQLSRLITKTLRLSGVQGVTSHSGRRTLAHKMAKHGIKYSFIGEILGIDSLEAVKRLCVDSPPCFKTIMKSII